MSANPIDKSARATHAHWRQHEERGSAWLLRFMAWIAKTFGRRLSRLILHPISLYFALTSREAREASHHYLTRVLGRKPGWRDFYRHVHCFSSVILDRVYFLDGDERAFDVQIHDASFAAARRAGSTQGALFMGGHFGSFECIRTAGRRFPELRFVLLMHEENASKMRALISSLNPLAQQEVIPLGTAGTMLKVRDALDEGAIIGLLADRSLSTDATVPIPFLGAPAYFPVGPWRMAAMLKCPVYLMAGIFQGGNRYDIHLEKIVDFGDVTANREQGVNEALARYVARLEHFCRAAPYNWFNFFDFWKPPESVIPPH